jgi:hypothetical protein
MPLYGINGKYRGYGFPCFPSILPPGNPKMVLKKHPDMIVNLWNEIQTRELLNQEFRLLEHDLQYNIHTL